MNVLEINMDHDFLSTDKTKDGQTIIHDDFFRAECACQSIALVITNQEIQDRFQR